MSTSLNIAIAAEFDLCEKIAAFLEQSDLAVDKLAIVEIYPFREEQGVRFNRKAVEQIALDEVEWAEINYLLFAGEFSHLVHLARAAGTGCVVVDMKGICSALSDVPVVVPSVNDEQLTELRQRNIVALPNPQVGQLALAVRPLLQEYDVTQLMVTSLLPASYTNAEQVTKLVGQSAQLLNGIPLDEGQPRLAFNVFPAAPQNLAGQLQRIFPSLDNVVFHQIEAPVFYGLGQMVSLSSNYELNDETVLEQWRQNPLIQYHSEQMITPVGNGETENGEDNVYLHISNLSMRENRLEFWTVADEQRFNMALLAVKLVELIYRQGY
ncbi:oxidoreductase [Pasteurellaceae bacterium LIM206]|nr:oxidoreductase [Pasteurellaceae bacterium LIM206]